MTVKTKTVYSCTECGYSSPKWLGKCPGCDKWDTFVEEVVARSEGRNARTPGVPMAEPQILSAVELEHEQRHRTGIEEFDRILGGGLVEGSLVLLGGEPGIGKSTLLLQASNALSETGITVLYVSGEESVKQTKMRAVRLGTSGDKLYIVSETNLDAIISIISDIKPKAVVIDSIQIIYSEGLESAPGSVSQLRESANRLMRLAKETATSIFLVGHITKEGAIAGPKMLEHIVDTVLYFEGERYQSYRVLRAVKNRFGATDEIGVFKMSDTGLAEVSNPSEIFLAERHSDIPGSIVIPSIEGTRPILVEIQALVSPTVFGMPNRKALGVDYNRVILLLAVLEKRLGWGLQSQDVFVNVAGGAKVVEPAADLGIVLAVSSSYRDRAIDKKLIAIGEVGLGGEIRSVNNVEKRVREGMKLGFTKFIVPQYNLKTLKRGKDFDQVELCGVDTLKEALSIAVK